MSQIELDAKRCLAWMGLVAAAGLLACGGDKAPAGGEATPAAGDVQPAPPAATDSPAVPVAADSPSAAPAAGPTNIGAQAEKPAKAPAATGGGGGDAALIAVGDSIFHGQAAGGTCYACHGQDAKGSAVGPNLTDAEWLHSDGSLAAITKTIQAGVPTPKKAPAPMPPMGGASLSPEQVRAVATYVHSLSKGG